LKVADEMIEKVVDSTTIIVATARIIGVDTTDPLRPSGASSAAQLRRISVLEWRTMR
jgi:hypothetical protein